MAVASSLNFNDCWSSLHQLDDDVNLQLAPVRRKAFDFDFQWRLADRDRYCRFGAALKNTCRVDSLDNGLIFHVSGIVQFRFNRKIDERQSIGCEAKPIERSGSTKPVVR